MSVFFAGLGHRGFEFSVFWGIVGFKGVEFKASGSMSGPCTPKSSSSTLRTSGGEIMLLGGLWDLVTTGTSTLIRVKSSYKL